MSPRRRRQHVEHTEDWERLVPLFWWPEQEEYELIRPLVLFGDSVVERAEETGASERTLYRRISGFEEEGMHSLFGSEPAKRRVLSDTIREMILELKAEHLPLNANEISRICYARTGRRPDRHTVQKVLSEEALQTKARRFETYHETRDPRERRLNVVELHYEGWTDVNGHSGLPSGGPLHRLRSTVYRVIRRWAREGPAGLEDKPRGRPKGVQKVDLRAILAVKEIQENPELGAFRVKAALEQVGIYLGVRTVGRILKMNRETYGLGKPTRSPHQKKQMPFEAKRRHQIWTADVRYVKKHQLPHYKGYPYVISILENYSRCILASAVSASQDTNSFLSVFYQAVQSYGVPEMLVTDSGGIFLSERAQAVYEFLGIHKREIEKGKPWQSYIETNFNTQRRMADYYFQKAESWQELVEAHERYISDYNAQRHWAHEHREGGRHSPQEVLGFVTGALYHPEDLQRAFFSARFTRKLDVLGYARFRHWRLYGEEGLATLPVALWVSEEALSVEYDGEALARYEVSFAATETGKAARFREVSRPQLFATRHRSPQLRLFGLDETLGEEGWLKAVQLDEYAPRRSWRPQALQEVLFST